VRREQRRLGEIVEVVEQFTAQNPAIATWRCGLAYVYSEVGRVEEARRELDILARDEFAALARDAVWMLGVVELSEVVAVLGDKPRAAVLHRLLEPFADRCVVNLNVLCMGSAARTLGVLATVLERWDDAEAHFEAALEANARIRGTLWVAHTRCGYADMLLRRGRPGDRDRALELLAEAEACAGALSLEVVATSARRLRDGIAAHQSL
jgi:tetratricopeptide (TPR) repeat protein